MNSRKKVNKNKSRSGVKKSRKQSSRSSRSSATCGWAKASPKTKKSRRSVKSKCGSRCFLLPSELKFPVCDSSCKVSCRGLVSAKVRAGQYKYKAVYNKASRMINSRGCTIKSRKEKSVKRNSRRSRK